MHSDKHLTLGFSPCPNDTFIFDAMVHHKIDTEGLHFDFILEDVETLNQKAFHQELDITKISFHAFIYVIQNYILLNSGGALGDNCGPLLVSKKEYSIEELSNLNIAIPGLKTTANLLLMLLFPEFKNKTELLFSEIEDNVLEGKSDVGLLIHENRFTYQNKGLKKIEDLGEYWFAQTHSPIPLGGIVVKRSFEPTLQSKIDRIIKRSVEFAFANPESSQTFTKQHAQALDEDVIKKHIELYVNNYSIDLGENGRKAIEVLFKKVQDAGLIGEIKKDIFVKK